MILKLQIELFFNIYVCALNFINEMFKMQGLINFIIKKKEENTPIK